MPPATLEQARAAKQIVSKMLADESPVVGIGITRVGDGYGVKLNLSEPLPPDADVPAEVDGVPIRVEVVGVIRAR